MKWRELVYLFKLIKSTGTRRPGLDDYDNLLRELSHSAADSSENGVDVCREDFSGVILAQFEIASRTSLTLYSPCAPSSAPAQR